MELSAETPGGASEIVEKSALNSSCEAEEKLLYKKWTKSTKLKFNREIWRNN